MSITGFKRIGLSTAITRGEAILLPRTGYSAGAGGEFGAEITDALRTFAIKREPVAFRVVFTVARDIYKNWFELQLEGDEKGDESKKLDKLIQTELSRLHAKRELTRKAVFERGFGWAILVLGYEDEAKTLADPVSNPTVLREIKAYSATQISKVDEDKQARNPDGTPNPRFGMPKLYHITQSGIAAKLRVHHSRVIHFATRWVDSSKAEWKGQSVLDDIWDDLVTLRNIRWGMGQTMFRTGAGFFDITLTGADKDAIQTWVDSGAFANLSNRSYFAHSEDQILETKGFMGKALDPMNYYLPPMEHVSVGTGIPLAILRGVEAGALTGSEVNQLEYYGVISDEQVAYEDGVRKLVEVIRKFIEDDEKPFSIEWQSGIELTEERKATIEKLEVDSLVGLGAILTRNELRAKYDPELAPLSPEQGGDEVLGKSPMLNDGGFNVKPHPDGSASVREIRKAHSLKQDH